MRQPNKTMLFVGEQWHGSNARSLCMAFRRVGWLVDIIDPSYYFPHAKHLITRIARRLTCAAFRNDLNAEVLRHANNLHPSLVFIYKGANIHPATLRAMAQQNIASALFFPDVSLYTHGSSIPNCIPYYHHIFTAKSFGIDELYKLGARSAHLVLHASDPDVHRPLNAKTVPLRMKCDVSFVGAWSPHKEKLLHGLLNNIPTLSLKIWGAQWGNNSSPILQAHIMHQEMFGDLYAATIQSARINLGLLSEQRYGASSGDLTTARTFEIPGCRAFMLHERTDEVLRCFQEGTEIECFGNVNELSRKVEYYLAHETERLAVANAGFERCKREHLYDHRALFITKSLAVSKRHSGDCGYTPIS